MTRSDNNDRSSFIAKHSQPRIKQIAYVLGMAVLFAIFCAGLFMFARSYRNLRDAILSERIDYVNEISAQIITSQIFMEEEYTKTAANLAHLFGRDSVATLSDIRDFVVSSDASEVLLVSEDNRVVDVSGRQIAMPDTQLAQVLIEARGVENLFTSLNYEDDSWLFIAPVEPKLVDGNSYKAIILSVSADKFRDNMTISLFDDLGASYIVNNDGRIKIKPISENLVFDGFNLFSSMRANGVSEQDVRDLEIELCEHSSDISVIKADGLDWLIGHTPIDSNTSLVVAIPLTITAAQTYKGLNGTIIYCALCVVVIALMAIIIMLRLSHRDRLREKEALVVAAKSEFLSKMSHDIRTPLHAVISLLQLAHDYTKESETKNYLAQSSTSAKYLLGIINDVLDVSRIDSGKLTISAQPFDMNELLVDVNAVILPLAKEKQIELTVEIERPLETEYIGDSVRTAQILSNLLSNSIKFTKQGGYVKLSISLAPGTDGRDDVTMVVTDNGIGMSKQFMEHMFTPFEQEQSSYTQQYAGTGLGLSIVNSLVKLMGGTINVTSQLGRGTEFTVCLPLKRGGELTRKPKDAEDERLSFMGKRVLLAEDAEVNQMIVSRLLSTKFGITTDVAQDGYVAVEMFSNSAPGTYDMIFMDIKMPRMDGLQAARAIRALKHPDARHTPIVALSANAFAEDVELSMQAGMNEHMPKPIDMKALTMVLRKYFANNQTKPDEHK